MFLFRLGFFWCFLWIRTGIFCEGSDLPEISSRFPVEDDVIHFAHETCQSKIISGDSFDEFYDTSPFVNENGVLEILVRLRGPSDGHILLTTSRNSSVGGYLVVIGSFANTQSEIRRSKWSSPVFKMNTPEIMSDIQFRGFVIRYNQETGTVRVYSEGSEMPLLHWRDDKPLRIRYISFAAYFDVVVQFAFNCKAKDNHTLLPRHLNYSDNLSEGGDSFISNEDNEVQGFVKLESCGFELNGY